MAVSPAAGVRRPGGGPSVSVVVPTLGLSRLLPDALAALRDQAASDQAASDHVASDQAASDQAASDQAASDQAAGDHVASDRPIEVEIVLVDQRPADAADHPVLDRLDPGLVDRHLRPGRNLGFAGGVNLGMAACRGELVATVNDDLLVEPGWLAALVEALAAEPAAAAAQGVNLQLTDPRRVDGWGLAWNRRWQAVQLGRGGLGEATRPPAAEGPPRPVFGVSATAALYRRSALAEVAAALLAERPDRDRTGSDGSDGSEDGGRPIPPVFDPLLGSYYEDVDLACRLRAAGHGALSVPAARARHAGSASGRRLGRRRQSWIYGNRLLVLARLLGDGFVRRLPALLGRDLRELAAAAGRGRFGEAAGIAVGWGRAARLLRRFRRRGEPLVPIAELARWQTDASRSAAEGR